MSMKKKRKLYTGTQINFLRRAYMSMTVEKLRIAFNKKFGLKKTLPAIKSALQNRGIVCGRKGKDRFYPSARIYTPKQVKFLRSNYKGRNVAELMLLFNKRFHQNKTWQQIKTFVHNRHIVCGRTGRFDKGITPWNKGLKAFMGPNRTSFKKGNVPRNIKPLGRERICSKDGSILIKIKERNPYTGAPTRYKHKHVHLWERKHGPVPKGMVVVFKDSNKLNCIYKNLMLLSRAELLRINKRGYKEIPDEIKPSILALAKLEVKTFIRKRELHS